MFDILKQFKLFVGLLLLRNKELVVRLANIGKDSNIRFDDVFELLHFTRLRNASLKNSEIVQVVDLPH